MKHLLLMCLIGAAVLIGTGVGKLENHSLSVVPRNTLYGMRSSCLMPVGRNPLHDVAIHTTIW